MNTQETLLVYMCHLEEATHSCKMGGRGRAVKDPFFPNNGLIVTHLFNEEALRFATFTMSSIF